MTNDFPFLGHKAFNFNNMEMILANFSYTFSPDATAYLHSCDHALSFGPNLPKQLDLEFVLEEEKMHKSLGSHFQRLCWTSTFFFYCLQETHATLFLSYEARLIRS